MKTDIHPKYFENVEIRCSCGNVVMTGSTKENLKTELCSKCHPFYTGQQKLVDTAGRVDKFQAQRTKAVRLADEAKKRKQAQKKKPEVYKEKEIPQEVLERSMAKTRGKWGKPLGESPAEEILKEDKKIAKKKKNTKKTKQKTIETKKLKSTSKKSKEPK